MHARTGSRVDPSSCADGLESAVAVLMAFVQGGLALSPMGVLMYEGSALHGGRQLDGSIAI